MDPFIIAAIISAVVILILSIAFLKVSQVKPQGMLSYNLTLTFQSIFTLALEIDIPGMGIRN